MANNTYDIFAKPSMYQVDKAAVVPCQNSRDFTCSCNLGVTEDKDSASEHRSQLAAPPDTQASHNDCSQSSDACCSLLSASQRQ